LIRLGTQRVSAPTATFFTVLTGAVLVLGLAKDNWARPALY
jgi:hypothetical protein